MATLIDELLSFFPTNVREQLSRDLDELHQCMQASTWKSAIVLTGSLIEAVLYHHIALNDGLKNTIPQFEKRNMGLTDLLQWARAQGVIDENLFRLSEPVRDYRNTIHPRVQQRVGVPINEQLVQIAYNVFLEMVRAVSVHQETLAKSEARTIVSDVIREVMQQSPTQSDLAVYVPIVEKYGASRGKLIIARSLTGGEQ